MKQKHFHISEGLSSDANVLVETTTSRKIKNAVAKMTFCLVGMHITLNCIWYINTCLEISDFQVLNLLALLYNI